MNDLEIRDTKFGPAMSALDPRHRLFVLAMFELGTGDATAAARAAGVPDNGGSYIRVAATRMVHREDVKLAMQEEARRRVSYMLPMALTQLEQVATSPQHKDQVRAISMIMNRAGLPESVEKNINVNVSLSDRDKLTRIKLLAEANNLPLDQVLGTVTDAEFTEIRDAEDDEFKNVEY